MFKINRKNFVIYKLLIYKLQKPINRMDISYIYREYKKN